MLGNIERERESRLAFLKEPDDSVMWRFEDESLKLHDPAVRRGLQRAWDYARNLDYRHPGQGAALYLAHPLRVTTLYMQLFRPADAPGLATAMLHNVMEVADVGRGELAAVVGEEVAVAVETLTVDRARQWDDDYKRAYYLAIESSPFYVPRVKILDKLDNLFLLCLNPSAATRDAYLREVGLWLIPMTQRVAPQLAAYVEALAEDCRRIGHRPLPPAQGH